MHFKNPREDITFRNNKHHQKRNALHLNSKANQSKGKKTSFEKVFRKARHWSLEIICEINVGRVKMIRHWRDVFWTRFRDRIWQIDVRSILQSAFDD